MTTPFLVHWDLADGWATSRQLPRVRIPGGPFMGVSGVAPSRAQVEAWTRREADLLARGGLVFPPDAAAAGGRRGRAVLDWRRPLRPGRRRSLRDRGGEERGYTREQAYVICSVAVDLRISNVVDVPNYVVSALLPEDIFQS
jgi:acetamidase/formamidase